MARKLAAPLTAGDEEARTLLARYKCPIPFHEVRTRFLGNVATPVASTSPVKIMENLWGGELLNSMDKPKEPPGGGAGAAIGPGFGGSGGSPDSQETTRKTILTIVTNW